METRRLGDSVDRDSLALAISPCPNDTFIFHALATGALSLKTADLRVSLHDVETLNQAALTGLFDITKLSFHAYLLVRERYHLLSGQFDLLLDFEVPYLWEGRVWIALKQCVQETQTIATHRIPLPSALP